MKLLRQYRKHVELYLNLAEVCLLTVNVYLQNTTDYLILMMTKEGIMV